MDNSPQLFDMSTHPGRILRQMMEEKGWTQDALATITGLSRQTISLIVSGKSGVTPETAVRLAAAFGNTAEEWMKWDGLYRLSQTQANLANLSDVEKMARLHEIAPIRDMQKRGWIQPIKSVSDLELELKKFFGSEINDDIAFPIALKRSGHIPKLSPAERAWCFRARQLAMAVPLMTTFLPSKLNAAEKKLRQLAAYRKEIRHVPRVLSEYGIRFVIVEPIPTVTIDGAAFWIDGEPVIAMSVRHDRIDGFWFTLMHEFAHIRNEDAISVDTDLIDGTNGVTMLLVEDEAERLANEAATASLIPPAELDSFIRRVGPLYPKERIVQFAHKIKIHPGVIVGQLQHRKEIGYSSLRDLLVKVRDVVTSTAMTDGWNQNIAPAIL